MFWGEKQELGSISASRALTSHWKLRGQENGHKEPGEMVDKSGVKS